MAERSRGVRASAASATISLRIPPDQKALVDRAASLLGKSRTEFMLESARRAAEEALLDRRLFLLDDSRYRDFVERLDASAEPGTALKKLLTTPGPWDA